MRFVFTTFKEILFSGKRPWLNLDISENTYKQSYNELSGISPQIKLLYTVEFHKASNFKRKYYVALIEEEVIRCINSINDSIKTAENKNQKIYVVYSLLHKSLKDIMEKTNLLLEKKELGPDKFLPAKGKIQKGPEADAAYIFQYLKHQLIRLYLEIQETYPEHSKTENASLEELYENVYFELCPEKPVIIKEVHVAPSSSYKPVEEPKEDSFKSTRGDVRELKKGVMRYSDIVKHKESFARFEELLFQQGYIDHEYRFIDKHGKKKELAILFHIVIDLGYFNKNTFKPLKSIPIKEYSKFLDYRYGVNLDKQFRSLNRSPELISTFRVKYWVSTLPVTR